MPDSNVKSGILYLLPSSLGNENVNVFLPDFVIAVIKTLDEFIVENEKTARQFLKTCGITIPQSQLVIHELDKHANKFSQHYFLDGLFNGKNIGLLSEAGCPGVADPGAEVVAAAHKKNIKVVPLVGPSSLLLALMASGLNGQQFTFNGYLPKEKNERIIALKKLEIESQRKSCTQIFIETPYRNNQLLNDMLATLSNETKVCVAADVTVPEEFIQTKTVAQWKITVLDLNKRPCVFLILA